jgi:uncharacterized cupredoxin-like copper-binding protein
VRRSAGFLVALVLSGALILAAACGGNDGGASKPTATVEATTAALGTTTPAAGTTATPDSQPAAPTETDVPETVSPGAINIELSDFAITPSVTSVPAGEVTLHVTNTGETYHSILIIKTTLAPDALPTDDDGSVDETADGIDVVDEIFELGPGEDDTIITELDPGAYVLVCNVVDDAGAHYQLGMRTAFTVTS